MSTAIAPAAEPISAHRTTHLRQLEAESIYVLREVAEAFESLAQDSDQGRWPFPGGSRVAIIYEEVFV